MRFNLEWSRAVAAGLSLSMLSGCGNLIVKVQKKPKDVDLKGVENLSALNLSSADDFLKQVDSLKAIGVDLLLKELAKKDYRAEVRAAIRKYRSFLIERAQGPVQIDDSFYFSGESCRKTGLSLNMEQANGFLGLILKTAVLAKLSEVSAGKLNPALGAASKELAAISQVIMMELGLKIKGDVAVDDSGEVTKTTGTFSIQLTDYAGEKIDEATKKADATQVLSMTFTRALGANYIGSFDATIEVTHEVSNGVVETLQAKLGVERKSVNDNFVHGVKLALGVKDKAPKYVRGMSFEQLKENNKQIKIADTLKTATGTDVTYVTILDVEKGTQCKSQGAAGDKGSEEAFLPPPPKGQDPAPQSPTVTVDPSKPAAPAPTPAPAPVVVNDKDDDLVGKPVYQGGTPTQTPSQTPTQSPTQSK